jgi:hypothetical protein
MTNVLVDAHTLFDNSKPIDRFSPEYLRAQRAQADATRAAMAAARRAPIDIFSPFTNSGITDQVGGTAPLGGWTDRDVSGPARDMAAAVTPAQRLAHLASVAADAAAIAKVLEQYPNVHKIVDGKLLDVNGNVIPFRKSEPSAPRSPQPRPPAQQPLRPAATVRKLDAAALRKLSPAEFSAHLTANIAARMAGAR